MKRFNGKAIYNPSGKAGEYSRWACNFYVGCSNGCEYCYCKKGILAGAMGQDKPQLKRCFRDENHALEVFERELMQNLDALQEQGLFFTFTSDPFLPETTLLTERAARLCIIHDVPVVFLTKCTDWEIDDFIREPEINGTIWNVAAKKHLFVFGFTLTGHDELEPNASPNSERIAAMRKLHNAGFRTFASIEPIIDLASSEAMIKSTLGFCDLYKIGLMTGGSKPDKDELFHFIGRVVKYAEDHGAKVYWKESIRRCFDFLDFDKSPCMDSGYNLFK